MRTDQKLFLLKCLLTIFLVILWILGSAVFGVVLWLRLDWWTREYLELDSSLDRYLILIYITLVDGALIFLFSLFGLIGGLRTVKWAIVVYLISLVFSFGLTVSGSVYGFIYREELRELMGNNDLISNIILNEYDGTSLDRRNRAVDVMQSDLGCCGADSPVDYLLSSWQGSDPDARRDMAPGSCCTDYFRHQDNPAYLCPIYDPTQTGQNRDYNPNIQREGCKTALVHFFENYVLIVAGVAVTMGVLQLVCLTIVSILIHILNNLYVPQPDDIVYDMARNQEKSPYPSRGDYKEYYT